MNEIYSEAVKLLNNGRDFVLATIITRDGSAPRGPGAKMIIRHDKSIAGTIGGGVLEAAVIEKAAAVIIEKKSEILEFHLSNDELATIDMTCGGDLKVFLDYIDSKDISSYDVFKYIIDGQNIKGRSFLVTMIGHDPGCRQNKFIINEDGAAVGNPPFNDDELIKTIRNTVRYKALDFKGFTLVVEPVNLMHSVYIFGAGHVGLKTAEFLKFVDFNVSVIDDRKEFANNERFPFADHVFLLDNFESCMGMINFDNNNYLVIVTRGHTNDEVVLRQALKTKACYIGMIGSGKKRHLIYHNLLKDDFIRKDLERVHAPIGIDIGADTPEEIAVSIAAELIKVRSGI